MQKIIYFVLPLLLTACSLPSSGLDKIDAYSLKVNNTLLFETFDKFTEAQGLPQTLSIGFVDYNVTSKDSILLLLDKNAADSNLVALLKYTSGLTMEYFDREHVVPFSIDFRNTKPKISYKDGIVFDADFSLKQFGKLFPNAVKFQTPGDMSLYKITTKDTDTSTQSYMIERKSKTDPMASPTLEFTFKNGKLIYIFFANF